ncbi:hypothetical protein [Clostridium faecium]|uniref:Uncharacterized protein n=1 Tax=Clostridium faecium TaxID=2762223 RepID=A0ABR8YNN0_9CLOT|nr:hypothetical protein [Clostridium faecium]MBD8045847.1 hypothetical protein [Clostridium faecium]
MPNILSKYASLFLAMLLIVINIYDRTNYMERYISNQVNVIANRFQKEARTKGYVDKEMYDRLAKELSNTDRAYTIKILHRDIKYYPVDKSIDENGYTVEYFKHNEREILETIYDKDKRYLMRMGDDFQISVVEKGVSTNNILWGFLTGDTTQKTNIFASFGGAVENEVD